jgi:hypothetical protein
MTGNGASIIPVHTVSPVAPRVAGLSTQRSVEAGN